MIVVTIQEESEKLHLVMDQFLKLVELESGSSVSLTISARHGKLTGTEVKINKGWA